MVLVHHCAADMVAKDGFVVAWRQAAEKDRAELDEPERAKADRDMAEWDRRAARTALHIAHRFALLAC